jgi:hypothetical protein
MLGWIKTLDQILRGQATQLDVLREDKIKIPIFGMAVVVDMLGIIYGACMGIFSIAPGGSGHSMQLVASMVKVPALFIATLVVTCPSLYVFNALVGSRLRFLSVMRVIIASLAVMLTVLASIGPIVGFFSFTTTSYDFMVLVNVFVFAVSGFLGLVFLLQTLHRMTISKSEIVVKTPETPPENATEKGPLDLPDEHVLAPHVRMVFRVWLVVFGLVGCQMAWVLRPFIGHPDQPFTWFRHPHSNFFEAVAHSAINLFR